MEKLEIQKKLQRQKASYIILMLLTGLAMPTMLTVAQTFKMSLYTQALVCLLMLSLIVYFYKQVQKIESRLKCSL